MHKRGNHRLILVQKTLLVIKELIQEGTLHGYCVPNVNV